MGSKTSLIGAALFSDDGLSITSRRTANVARRTALDQRPRLREALAVQRIVLTERVPLLSSNEMHFNDERRAMVLTSMGFIRGQFASNGIDLGIYSDDQVADALLITCPAILGSQAWLNEKHLQRTSRLLRT